jgi:hypothetical protein
LLIATAISSRLTKYFERSILLSWTYLFELWSALCWQILQQLNWLTYTYFSPTDRSGACCEFCFSLCWHKFIFGRKFNQRGYRTHSLVIIYGLQWGLRATARPKAFLSLVTQIVNLSYTNIPAMLNTRNKLFMHTS